MDQKVIEQALASTDIERGFTIPSLAKQLAALLPNELSFGDLCAIAIAAGREASMSQEFHDASDEAFASAVFDRVDAMCAERQKRSPK